MAQIPQVNVRAMVLSLHHPPPPPPRTLLGGKTTQLNSLKTHHQLPCSYTYTSLPGRGKGGYYAIYSPILITSSKAGQCFETKPSTICETHPPTPGIISNYNLYVIQSYMGTPTPPTIHRPSEYSVRSEFLSICTACVIRGKRGNSICFDN